MQSVTPFRTLPFGGHDIPPIAIPGRPDPPNMGGQLPYLIAATPELFDILGVKIVQGRRFVAADDRGEKVTIVNETMAREGWPGESALGKCIRIGFDPLIRSVHGGWSSRAVDVAALSAGCRSCERRPPAIGGAHGL